MATCIIVFVIFLWKILNSKTAHKVYLVNYACYKPKKSQQRTRKQTLALGIAYSDQPKLKDEAIKYLWKGAKTLGIGDSTYLPEQVLMNPPDLSMNGAIKEAEAAMYGAIDALLANTGISTDDIGVLVVNCSLFNPVPSLSSRIVNRYKLKHSIKNFNLSGMGCSAGLSAIGLAKHLLQVHENTIAMIVSTEVISQSMYRGDDLTKLTANIVFRAGGAAILLSNRPSDRHKSKYELIETMHTNTANSDTSHKCVYQEEDEQGLRGVTVTYDILVEAPKAITAHIIKLCYTIHLPISLKFQALLCYLLRKPYTPNFKRVFHHCFPHVGAKSVIDAFERNVKVDVEAARMTLYRFGNTSSSSIWYEMAYAESKRRIKKGNRVWQIAFGSGFKCSSVIWHALKNVEPETNNNPWNEDIDDSPINLDSKEETE